MPEKTSLHDARRRSAVERPLLGMLDGHKGVCVDGAVVLLAGKSTSQRRLTAAGRQAYDRPVLGCYPPSLAPKRWSRWLSAGKHVQRPS